MHDIQHTEDTVHNVSSMKVTTDATQDCIHLKLGEFFAQRNANSTTCGAFGTDE